jgi:hypothetical protein
MHQRSEAVDSRLGNDDHTSAIAAVAAVRSAARDEFLTTKAHTAVAASSSQHIDCHAINKHVSFLRRGDRQDE